jgi:hypothetical protein
MIFARADFVNVFDRCHDFFPRGYDATGFIWERSRSRGRLGQRHGFNRSRVLPNLPSGTQKRF